MSIYSSRPNLLIGFHGCKKEDQQKLLESVSYVKKSQNNYDWLGHGMYFWENNLERAMLWVKKEKRITSPAVVGAVIDLGNCLDLFDTYGIELLKKAFKLFEQEYGDAIPQNEKHEKETGDDKILRYRDCAVLEFAHKFFERSGMKPFDSLRAAFMEGDQIYPGAGFREKTHIQICIRNPNCIKGFFLPRKESTDYSIV